LFGVVAPENRLAVVELPAFDEEGAGALDLADDPPDERDHAARSDEQEYRSH
jgi:hypothetical protein